MLSVDSMDKAQKGWKKHSQRESKRPFKNYLSKRKKLCCGCCAGANFEILIRMCIFIAEFFDSLLGSLYSMLTFIPTFIYFKISGKTSEEIYGYKDIHQNQYQTEFREHQNKSEKMLKKD